MGQRHNRRRTRPRSRSNRSRAIETLLDTSLFPNEHCAAALYKTSGPAFLVPLAHTRHNWVGGWQGSEYTSKQQQQHCHADDLAMRFFGGEPGDDARLCYNMWDYFGRLDYIDT